MIGSALVEVILKIVAYIFGRIEDKEKAKRALSDLLEQIEQDTPKQAELRKKYSDKRSEMQARKK
jgi:hypothetical protein